ncbi:MAG: hypothetical protein LIR50_16480 [Bacillota bacterium]|nr:hypothetical protein [Bacillota bacterium]
MNNFHSCFLYFSSCAFFGWIMESSYRTILERRFFDAGFLYGPIAPIYGIAALLIYFADIYTKNYHLPIRLFILFLIPILVEYMMSYFLEKAFHVRLWDYSNFKLNIHGRVCLPYSILWFFLVLAGVYVLQPAFINAVSNLPPRSIKVFTWVLIVLFTVNIVYSVNSASNMTRIKSIFRTTALVPNQSGSDNKEVQLFIEKTNEAEDEFDYSRDTKFYALVQDIAENPVYEGLKKYHHHQHNIYDHSIRVSYISYRTGVFLSNYMKINISDLTRGAMLHDFFLYDWRKEKPASGKLHAFEHPKEALSNSITNFSPISKMERDIILKHMWPINIIPPRYFETLIVATADKYVAAIEVFNEEMENIKIKRILNKQKGTS